MFKRVQSGVASEHTILGECLGTQRRMTAGDDPVVHLFHEKEVATERGPSMREFSPPTWTRTWRIVGILFVVAIAGIILWSVWSETMAPLIRERDWRGLSLNLIGIPLILLGAIALVCGGVLFVNRTAIAFGDETFHERAAFVRTDPRPEARWEVWKLNLRMLGELWRPALILLAVALALIIAGGILINM